MTESADLDPEDAKLVTLARGARARVGASEGAALRDETGRTYSGATVSLPSLALSALQLAVAQAVNAGASGVEAVVVLAAGGRLDVDEVAALIDLGGTSVPVYLCTPAGTVVSRSTAGELQ